LFKFLQHYLIQVLLGGATSFNH